MRGMNDQQRLSKSVRSERSALVAFGVVIVLLFKVNLASWVLSLSLAKDMSIQCGYDCVQQKNSRQMTFRRVLEINVESIVDKSSQNIRVDCFRCKVQNIS